MIEVITDNNDRFLMDDHFRFISPLPDNFEDFKNFDIEIFQRFSKFELAWITKKSNFFPAYTPNIRQSTIDALLKFPGVKSVIDLDPTPEEECPEFDEQGQLIIY